MGRIIQSTFYNQSTHNSSSKTGDFRIIYPVISFHSLCLILFHPHLIRWRCARDVLRRRWIDCVHWHLDHVMRWSNGLWIHHHLLSLIRRHLDRYMGWSLRHSHVDSVQSPVSVVLANSLNDGTDDHQHDNASKDKEPRVRTMVMR